MFEQHPLRSHGFQNHSVTCHVRDAFYFSRPSAPPDMTGCDRVWPREAGFFRAAAVHNDKYCFCVPQCRKPAMRFKRWHTGGNSEPGAPDSGKAWRAMGGQSMTAEAWRPYPLPFAAQRLRLRRVAPDCCSGNPEQAPAWPPLLTL